MMKIKVLLLILIIAVMITGCACTTNETTKPTATHSATPNTTDTPSPSPTESFMIDDLIPTPNVTTSPDMDDDGDMLPPAAQGTAASETSYIPSAT